MIDTVRFIRRCIPRQQFHSLLATPPRGWHAKRSTHSGSNGNPYTTTFLTHKSSGLSVHFFRSGQAVVQVSLPKLIYGRNAKLIATQAELQRALRRADKLFLEVAKEQIALTRHRFTRVDLVWQVRGRIDDFIAAHQHLPHPVKIRGDRKSIVYYRETILWAGSECSLSIYDKLKEMGMGRGDIVRIELRLLDKTLKRMMGAGNFLGRLSILKCYDVLRQAMLRLQPKQIYHVTDGFDVMYWAAKNKWRIHGRPAVDVLLDGYESDKHRNLALNRIRNYHLKAHGIDWQKLLPPKMPQLLLVKKGCSYTL